MRKFKLIKGNLFKLVDQYNECCIILTLGRKQNWRDFFEYYLISDKLNLEFIQSKFSSFEEAIEYFDHTIGPNNLKRFRNKATLALIAGKI